MGFYEMLLAMKVNGGGGGTPTRKDIFGTFLSGIALGKSTTNNYPDTYPLHSIMNNTSGSRAAMFEPIPNKGYVLTVTDPSEYSLAVYDVLDDTPIATTYQNAVFKTRYEGGTKSISWLQSDSATTPYIMVALKKNSGEFTNEELANGAEAVFTFTT